MSFLSILLVASAFYFAHARPDSQSSEPSGGAQANDGGVKPAPEIPDYSVPVPDLNDYQQKLFGFMQDIEKAVDQYVTPMMSKLDLKKQDELKSEPMNGFASYFNYLPGRR